MKFGKYKIINKIATGGMAEVFRAKITGEMGFEKLLVIKKVLPHLAAEDQWITHFIDEAKLAALLQHENIIHIYDFGKIDNCWFLAMEYLSGKDLKDVFIKSAAEKNHITLENILHIIIKICDGLDYAHTLKSLKGNPLNIIHRDISPQNICITFDGKVKIIDFGIAKAAERSVHTQTGIIKGKLAYMSPEQASGKAIDNRSDIFPVGIILYELLTGKRMYKGEVSEILLKVVQADYEPAANIIKDCPTELLEIIDKALAKEPDDRYQTAGEMCAALEEFMYKSDFRSGSRKLAEYMQTLFKGDYTSENYETIETQDLTSADNYDDESDIPETAVLDSLSPETGTMSLAEKKIKEIIPAIKKTFSPLASVPAIVTNRVTIAGNALKSGGISKQILAFTLTCLVIVSVIMGVWLLNKRNDQNVVKLLTSAENCLKKGRLTEPIEDSAYFYFKEVLEIDNDDAKKGIQKIVRNKIKLAKSILSRFRHKDALVYINSGLAIDPENKELLELKVVAGKKVSNRLIGKFKTIFNPKDKTE